jgi:hypothetical protein
MSRLTKFSSILMLAGGFAVWAAAPASATILNLTSLGSSGNIGAAFFQQVSNQSTGTGVIDPFVRLQHNGSEMGFNTDYRPLNGDLADVNNSPQFTHSLKVGDFGVVNQGGVQKIRFLLDINQTSNNPYLSLDRLKVYVADAPDLHTNASLFSQTLIYDMDAGGDSKVLMDYRLESGSGSGDMFAYLPYDLLSSYTNKYLYLFSEFGASGDSLATNDGFEEWARVDGEPPASSVPEPTTLLLLGAGLAGSAFMRRRRRSA